MPRNVLLDELHMRVLIPRELPAPNVRAIRRQLNARGFNAVIRQAIRSVFQRNPALRVVRLQLTR
jgi:hypothetical protein